jgi:hypothetical protein
MTKPLYFYNGTTFEQVGPTTPQSPIAYQTSAPTGPATGDLWIDSDGDVDTYNRQLTRYYFVATAAQTTITGTDANGLTLAYVAGSEAVYVNGALQVRGQDYTATNGTSVVMTAALAVNDVVEIFAYTAFTVANAYTKSETDGLVGAAAGLKLLVPTSVAVGSGSGSVGTNGTVTFTGASSVSLNGVFSTTYENYMIQLFYKNTVGQSYTALRYRVAGADDTNSVYDSRTTYMASGSIGVTDQPNLTSQRISYGDNNGNYHTINISRPFTADKTYIKVASTNSNGANETYAEDYFGVFQNATSFTGFTIFPAANNLTGTISVYGFKN